MSLNLEEHYDKIYRYCYFKLHNREQAEDITQETFLRYLKHYNCLTTSSALKCLYTIARHLCIDAYRKDHPTQSIDYLDHSESMEDDLITKLSIKGALANLSPMEQELLLLRYVNELPVSTLCKLYDLSRFTIYRKLLSASNRFREELRKEEVHASMEKCT